MVGIVVHLLVIDERFGLESLVSRNGDDFSGASEGGGDTIPCNWKEIYRGYKLSATCVQHSKCICT